MSLLESCLTLAIASTAAMLAVPPLVNASQNYLLISAASDVSTRLQSARINAVIRNCPCRVRVISTSQYVVECQNPVWTTLEIAEMPAQMGMTADASPEYHPRGTVAPTGTITIWNSAGRQKQIVVNILGRIRIQ